MLEESGETSSRHSRILQKGFLQKGLQDGLSASKRDSKPFWGITKKNRKSGKA